MRSAKFLSAIGVLLGLTLFLGGMVSSRLLSSSQDLGTNGRGAAGQTEGLTITGAVQMDAYHADGKIFASWTGHNALGIAAKNGLAACLPGLNPTPAYYNGCSSFIQKIYIGTQNGPICCLTDGATATNTALPTGCDSNTGNNPCNGWKSTSTIEVASSYTVNLAAGTHAASGAAFDWVTVNPSFAVTAGDRVIVTITFTVN
jgi:hypothetical protein